jgi:hypothetical protein
MSVAERSAEFDRLEAEIEMNAKDAARYRTLRRGQYWSVIDSIGDTLRADDLDAAIDAALLHGGQQENERCT